MSAPSPKRIALLVTTLMVVSAAALVLSASDYEGQDGATENQVVTEWTDAKAVIFGSTTLDTETTYYRTVQGAIDAAVAGAETTWKWTIYVKEQTIGETIDIPYQSSSSTYPADSPGLVEITLRGISDTEPAPTEEPEDPTPEEPAQPTPETPTVIAQTGAGETITTVIALGALAAAITAYIRSRELVKK